MKSFTVKVAFDLEVVDASYEEDDEELKGIEFESDAFLYEVREFYLRVEDKVVLDKQMAEDLVRQYDRQMKGATNLIILEVQDFKLINKEEIG